ncbi:sporulation integral membrane protein YtvI [Anoxybacillus flavithermus]|nr:sporulation integral membrane protein YtvI [Anoxybacillus flavithermus]
MGLCIYILRMIYEMKAGVVLLFEKIPKRSIYMIVILIAIVLLTYWVAPIAVPILFAFITAIFLEPAVKVAQQRLGLKRQSSTLLVFSLFTLFMFLSGYFIITKIVAEAFQFFRNSPLYLNEMIAGWNELVARWYKQTEKLPPFIVAELSQQVDLFLTKLKTQLTASLSLNKVSALVANVPKFLINFLVYLITLFLFMHDLPKIREAIFSHLTEETREKVHFMLSRLSYVVFGFWKAQFLVSLIIFAVSLVGLLLITPKVALFTAFIIWVIDFIPIIGSIVVMAPWAIFHFVTGDTVLATKLSILGVILLILRRTIEPKVMGAHIGLSPLATLISMYLGVKMMGALGLILFPLLLIGIKSAKEAGIIKLNFKL